MIKLIDCHKEDKSSVENIILCKQSPDIGSYDYTLCMLIHITENNITKLLCKLL